MTGPALEAWRFGMACLVGLGVGGVHSLLRPLRLHHPVTADLLFLPFLGYGWLYVSFAICRGDIRIGYVLGILVGAIFWEMLPGRWLRPVIWGVWSLFGRFFRVIFLPFGKIFEKNRKIAKKLFAIWKKWFTMGENRRPYGRTKGRGVKDGKEQRRKVCVSPFSAAAQVRGAGNRGAIRRSPDRSHR